MICNYFTSSYSTYVLIDQQQQICILVERILEVRAPPSSSRNTLYKYHIMVDLFGGAIVASIPPSWRDVSLVRQVPGE